MSLKSINLNNTNVYNKASTETNRFRFKTKLNAIQKTLSSVTLKRNKIGNSDLEVSEICMGCMMMGSLQITESEAHEILNYAWDCGINFLNTSEIYPIMAKTETTGNTSKIVGNWIKTRKREDVIVATQVCGPMKQFKIGLKMNRYLSPDSDELIQVEPGIDRENIKGAAESELRRLNINEIDLFQFQSPDRYRPSFFNRRYRIEEERESTGFEEQVEAVGELIKEGKIRYWGLSNETTYGLVMTCLIADKLNVPRPISIQKNFSLVDRRCESELAEACSARNLNIGLLPFFAFGEGYLSGKYLNGQRPEDSRFVKLEIPDFIYKNERLNNATKEYIELAKSIDLTPAQLAYLFVRSKWFVSSILMGVTNVEQLHENVSAFEYNLSQETLKVIDEIYLRNPDPRLKE